MGFMCGAIICGLIVAVLQFSRFFNDRYLEVFQPEVRFLRLTWKVNTVRADALLNTLIASYLGAIAGIVVGVIWGIVSLILGRRS